jgi:hypothetical protein
MGSEQAQSEQSDDVRVGACVYLLHALFQRLEEQQPGQIADMTEGVLHDRAAMNREGSAAATRGAKIADEALRMLRLMSEQLKSAGQ